LVLGAIREVTENLSEFAKRIGEKEPERPIAGVIAERTELQRDCASPDISKHVAIVYQGVGYVLGEQGTLAEEAKRKLRDTFCVASEGQRLPSFWLLTRSKYAENAMGSWMGQRHDVLTCEDFDPSAFRTKLIDEAQDELERRPSNKDAWLTLNAVGRPALSPEQRLRLESAFDTVSLTDMLTARLRLGGALPDNILAGKLHGMAKTCAKAFPGPVHFEDRTANGEQTGAARCLGVLMTLIGEAAKAPRGAGNFNNLHGAAIAVAHGWPAAAPALRSVFDVLVRKTAPIEAQGIWRTFIWLRSWE
jgi:hypothetical protein